MFETGVVRIYLYSEEEEIPNRECSVPLGKCYEKIFIVSVKNWRGGSTSVIQWKNDLENQNKSYPTWRKWREAAIRYGQHEKINIINANCTE